MVSTFVNLRTQRSYRPSPFPLQAGSAWLTEAHLAWLDEKTGTANDEKFSVALAAWTEMEQVLRSVFNFEGCIHGPDRHCPDAAPVRCDFCKEVY
jgi:hypothetical protein